MNREEMEGAISGIYENCLNCGHIGMEFWRRDKEYDSINNQWLHTKIYNCPRCGSLHINSGYMVRYIKETIPLPENTAMSGAIPWEYKDITEYK
jgi:hypothetical protein